MSELATISTEELLYNNPVRLERNLSTFEGVFSHEYIAVLRNSSEPIGRTKLTFWSDGTKVLDWPSIRPTVQGEGLGLAMYVQAARAEVSADGHVLVSQYPSESATRVWRSLVRRGLAEELPRYPDRYHFIPL